MRILLLTDTHGELDIINELIEREKADCCIHCGDFGFYDEESPNRLSKRELQLRIRHSHLPKSIRKKSYHYDKATCQGIIEEEGLLNGFLPYLRGEKTFLAPVYAVWGNHEDIETVRQLRNGTRSVENLHLIDESNSIDLPGVPIRLVGLGGNFYIDGEELFAPDISGDGGRVRASWLQYATLMAHEKAYQEERTDDTKTFFVSHVSPGKSECQLLERLCLTLKVRLSLSGHMDPPIPHAYSLFAFCEPPEALTRSQETFDKLKQRWQNERETSSLSEAQKTLIDQSLVWLDHEPLAPEKRGQRAPKGSLRDAFYTTQFLNLADTPHGWAVMDIEGHEVHLRTHAQWKL